MSQNLKLTDFFLKNPDSRKKIWHKEAYICREGEPMDRLYLLTGGKCRIFRDLNQGRTILYRIYLPGSVIGDIEIFTGMDASCSVQCMTEAETFSISMDLIRENLPEYADMIFTLGRGIARKMHENSVNESINTAYSLETRLAHYYLTFTDPGLQAENLGQLAEWMGCSYRHLTRSLAGLTAEGAIEKTRGGYRAADILKLQAAAASLIDEEKGRGLFEKGE